MQQTRLDKNPGVERLIQFGGHARADEHKSVACYNGIQRADLVQFTTLVAWQAETEPGVSI